MHPNKVWHSLTESILEKAAAAWRWLLTYTRGKADGTLAPGITMDSAAFSKWMLPCIIVVREGDGAAFASLGNSTWGALVWPVEQIGADIFAFSNGPVSWMHVSNPTHWSVLNWVACMLSDHGIVMQKIGDNVPLINYVLVQKKHGLHSDDFARCADLLGIPHDRIVNAAQLLTMLANHVAPNDDDYAKKAK